MYLGFFLLFFLSFRFLLSNLHFLLYFFLLVLFSFLVSISYLIWYLIKDVSFQKCFLLYNKHLQAFFLYYFFPIFILLPFVVYFSLTFLFFLPFYLDLLPYTFRSTLAEGCLIWYYLQAFRVYNLSQLLPLTTTAILDRQYTSILQYLSVMLYIPILSA